MATTAPVLTTVPEPTGLAVVQDLGGGWVAVYRLGLERPTIDSVTVVPMARSLIGSSDTARPTGDLSSRMLRKLAPGAVLAHAAASWYNWAGPPTVPLPGNRGWLAGHLGGERLASLLGPQWLAAIKRLEGKSLHLDPRDERRWRLVTTAARYVAAIEAGDRKPVATVALDLGLTQSKVRDRLYAARQAGLLETTGRGRAGGSLTPGARALLVEEPA